MTGEVVNKIVHPDREVRLADGRAVVVRRWRYDQGRLMAARVLAILARVRERRAESASASDLVEAAHDEVYALVRDTLGWDDAAMRELLYEDFLELASAVVEVCLLRPDGGGVLGKAFRLVEASTSWLAQAGVAPTTATRRTSSPS